MTMKRFGKRLLCALLAVCMVSALTYASAAEQASDYLSSYSATLVAEGDGGIGVIVDVDGTGYMSEIGATEIHVYESTNNRDFDWVASYYSDDYPEMLGSGTYYYDTPIVHDGVAGRYYIATVKFYAADSTGSDDATYTTVSRRAT